MDVWKGGRWNEPFALADDESFHIYSGRVIRIQSQVTPYGIFHG